MKRFLLIVLFILLAFYVAWPAISAWQIHSAVESGNARALERKVDFASVRRSLVPVVEQAISEQIDAGKATGGVAATVLSSVLQGPMLRQVTTVVLDQLVTPDTVIMLSRDPGTLADAISRSVTEQVARITGKASTPETSGGASAVSGAPGANPANSGTAPQKAVSAKEDPVWLIGLANIRYISPRDPLSFEVGLSRDPAATKPDVVAEMGFVNFDWKLTGLVPKTK